MKTPDDLRQQWEAHRTNPTIETETQYAAMLGNCFAREFPVVYAELRVMGGDCVHLLSDEAKLVFGFTQLTLMAKIRRALHNRSRNLWKAFTGEQA